MGEIRMSLTDLAEAMTEKASTYQEGLRDYHEGSLYEQNPYKAGTVDYNRWQEGWLKAEEADEEEVFSD